MAQEFSFDVGSPVGSDISGVGALGGASGLSATGNVLLVSNLSQVLEIQEEASEDAAAAAGKVIAGRAKKVELAGGFKEGTGKSELDHAQYITSQVVEDSDPIEVRVGLPEKYAPERSYYIYWQMGFFSQFSNQFERNRWLTRSMARSRSAQSNAAVAAAETQLSLKKQVTGFARGFAVFGAVSFFT